MSDRTDLLTADGSQIRHFVECVAPLAKHGTAGPNPNHAYLRDEIVRQCRAASPVDLDAERREAVSKAFNAGAKHLEADSYQHAAMSLYKFSDRYLARVGGQP